MTKKQFTFVLLVSVVAIFSAGYFLMQTNSAIVSPNSDLSSAASSTESYGTTTDAGVEGYQIIKNDAVVQSQELSPVSIRVGTSWGNVKMSLYQGEMLLGSVTSEQLRQTNASGEYLLEVSGDSKAEYGLYVIYTKSDGGSESVLFSKKIAASVSPEGKDRYVITIADLSVKATDGTIISSKDEWLGSGDSNVCLRNDTYFGIVKQVDYRSLPMLRVYKNNSATLSGTCQTPTEPEIFSLELEATYPLYILGEYIITDTGTGPSGRVLSAYNLLTQEEVFSEGYGGITSINQDTTISYWRSSNIVPLKANCPGMEEIERNYLTPEVQELVTRNLARGDLAVTKTRCIATQ